LDSDDILPENMLGKMIDFMQDQKSDAVVLSESRFFRKNIKEITNVSKNKNYDEAVTLKDIFEEKRGFVTQVNFLYTKKSFLEAGGYPVHHGFDTQGFGWKYLAKGFKVKICPNSFYHHRQDKNNNSYFQRVYKQGLLSRNNYLICEDVFYLFSQEAKKLIMEFDIFGRTKLDDQNLKARLDILYKEKGTDLFIDNQKEYLNKDGFDIYFEKNKDSDLLEDQFCFGIYHYKKGDYKKAISYFLRVQEGGINSLVVYYNILRCTVALSANYVPAEIENRTDQIIKSLIATNQQISRIKIFLSRLRINLNKVFKNE